MSNLNSTQPGATNEQRIRLLEQRVERLTQQLVESKRRSFRNPVACLVQLPESGVAGRASDSDLAVEVELDVVWTDADRRIYVTGQTQICRNDSTTEFPGQGSRLAWALQHDDGYYHLHAFDCHDEADNVVLVREES